MSDLVRNMGLVFRTKRFNFRVIFKKTGVEDTACSQPVRGQDWEKEGGTLVRGYRDQRSLQTELDWPILSHNLENLMGTRIRSSPLTMTHWRPLVTFKNSFSTVGTEDRFHYPWPDITIHRHRLKACIYTFI